jgi:tRNA(Ile)-lysidine synthase TilS/MesJ
MADILSKAGAKFAGALSRLTDGGFRNGTLGLAVSGGPDSLAMLLLAHRAIPGQFKVATVDHGLAISNRLPARRVMRCCKIGRQRMACNGPQPPTMLMTSWKRC